MGACNSGSEAILRRTTGWTAAKVLVHDIFLELENSCLEEKRRYEQVSQKPSAQKQNYWDAHIGVEQIENCLRRSMEFLLRYPEFLSGGLTPEQLRFAVLTQHFISEDTEDFRRPVIDRQHDDSFEGFLTKDGVNSQLLKDAHRAEWAIEGQSYLMPESKSLDSLDDRKRLIAQFQEELVSALETFLLDFSQRRCLSEEGTRHLCRAVTTQMSQCGIANLDRCSQAGKYLVGGQGLEQRINYSLSSMAAGSLGEGLKLTMLCLKTGFRHYQTRNVVAKDGSICDDVLTPRECAATSFLYQYATLRFTTAAGIETTDGKDRIHVDVIDALDEVRIDEARA